MAAPFLTVTLQLRKGEKVIPFANPEKFLKWTNEQLTFWRALATNSPGQELRPVINDLQEMQSKTKEQITTGTSDSVENYLTNINVVVTRRNIRAVTGSEEAKFLEIILEESPVITQECFRVLCLSAQARGTADILARTHYRVGEFLEHGGAKTTAPIKRALITIKNKYQGSIEELEQSTHDAQVKSAKEVQNARDLTASQLKTANKLFSSSQDEREQRVNVSIEEINATNDLFINKMKLQAPADYWSKKAKAHQEASANARKYLIIYVCSIVALLSLFLLMYLASLDYIENIDLPLFGTVILLGFAGTLSTIAFWIGRVMTRIYLSEHHLAIDAEERSVMAETYLALMEKGGATEVERPLILNALFRPTADGVVKDDAAPLWNLQSVVSGAMTNNG